MHAALALVLLAAHPADDWPQWRGPLQTGVSPTADPPTTWDAGGTNIRWKTPLPGRGHSTPIVWGERIFVTAAIPIGPALPPRPSTAPGNHDNDPVTHKQRFVAIALSRRDGQVLWNKTLREALPAEQGHRTASLASSSPVTDGERLYVLFGSFGLYCLDFQGAVVWQADFGPMQSLHGHGEGSSPVLYGETLIVNWDHEGQSFAAALDKRTGKTIWKVARSEVTSWATPIVVEHAGRTQVVISGTSRVRGYDLATGQVLWECGGLSANVVASPVSDGRLVFAGSSYDKRALLAIRLAGAAGDITDSKEQIVWRRFRGTPYVPSPLLYDGGLYFLTHYQGILSRVDAQTGEDRPGAMRLGDLGDIYASPVAAAGRIYVTDLEGATAVVAAGEIPRLIAINRLDESIAASPALSGRELLLRGQKHLYSIAAGAGPAN